MSEDDVPGVGPGVEVGVEVADILARELEAGGAASLNGGQWRVR